MSDSIDERVSHWRSVYRTRAVDAVSWYQTSATTSLAMIADARLARETPLIDVGAGASTLVDGLLAEGYRDITLLDLAEEALAATRARIGERAEVHAIAADVLTWAPPRRFGLWHDRAVFHFLTDESARAAYRRTLEAALAPEGVAVIATFALDGPERCSGLPVCRYSPETLSRAFDGFTMLDARREVHRTPAGSEQPFTFVRLARAAG